MLCEKPYLVEPQGIPVPCGRCGTCRVEAKRLWMSRLLLESMEHSEQCFVTLTYSDENLPKDGNLNPRHTVLFLKSLREKVSPKRVRFFLVGEYGSKTWRPHYHALLFGISLSVESELLVRSVWPHGFVQIGDVSRASIRYVCGYVMKKMTRPGDRLLDGRVPEFVRMSRCPGIGAGFASRLASCLLKAPAALSALASGNGIPSTVKVGPETVRLGRYLRDFVSKEVGVPRVTAVGKAVYEEKLLDLLQYAPAGASLSELVSETQRCLSVKARERVFNSKRKL